MWRKAFQEKEKVMLATLRKSRAEPYGNDALFFPLWQC
jgi:hypothetical protein